MYDILSPPAERDLPRATALRMRARLLVETGRPPARPVRRRLAVASALVLAAGAAAVGLAARPEPAAATVLAMGPAELPTQLQRAVQQCLTWGRQLGIPVTVSQTDLAVASQRGDTAAALFLTEAGYLTCQVQNVSGAAGPMGGGLGTDTWKDRSRDWLPGPVDRLMLVSSERGSGDVTVIGRVSSRVNRLVLQWAGHTVEARLNRGAFGLITPSGARVTGDAQLVSYDAAGQEIDRRPLFVDADGLGRCYVDPAGAMRYGTRGPNCQPADPWSRPR